MGKACLRIVLFLLIAAGVKAGPCLFGTLDDYIALGPAGCTVSALELTGFSIEPGMSFATPIDTSAVSVTPLAPMGPGGGAGLLLDFNNLLAGPDDLLELFLRFNAAAPPGLVRSSVRLLNPVAGGTGVVTATQDVCAGGSFSGPGPVGCTGVAGSIVTFQDEFGSLPSGALDFSPSSFFDVFVDITLDGGPAGKASLGQVQLLFFDQTEVPEPSGAVLFITGLAGMLLFARFRRT